MVTKTVTYDNQYIRNTQANIYNEKGKTMKNTAFMIQAGLAEIVLEASEWNRLTDKQGELNTAIQNQVIKFGDENQDKSPEIKAVNYMAFMKNNEDVIKKYITVQDNAAKVAKHIQSVARRTIQYCNVSDDPKAPGLADSLRYLINQIDKTKPESLKEELKND